MSAFITRHSARFTVILLLVASLAFFYESFVVLFTRWFESNTYYSHGPIVVIAFFWLFKKRLNLSPPGPTEPSPLLGAVVIGISILLNLFGLWQDVNILKSFSLYLFLAGNTLFFLGKYCLLRNWDLYLYLLLAIPLPTVFVVQLTFSLKLFSSKIAGLFLSFVYPHLERQGNILTIGDYTIIVTPVCSGLRSLFGMLSLVVAVAFLQTKRLIAVIDLLLAIPAAILTNTLRIVVVSILVVNGHGTFALKDWHDEIGLTAFCIVFVLISLFNELSLKKYKTETTVSLLRLSIAKPKHITAYVIVFVGVIALSVFGKYSVQSAPLKQLPLVTQAIPKSVGQWTSTDKPLGEYYYRVLGTKDILMRKYSRGEKTQLDDIVYLYVVHSQTNRKAVHPPEICIEGEGYSLLKRSNIVLLNQSNPIPAARMLFSKKGKGLLVYFWYRFDGKNISNYLTHQLFSVQLSAKNKGASMVRLSVEVDLNDVTQKENLLEQFVEEVIPEILEEL